MELLLGMGLAPSRGWLRGAFASYDTSGDGALDAAEMEHLQEVRARVLSPTPTTQPPHSHKTCSKVLRQRETARLPQVLKEKFRALNLAQALVMLRAKLGLEVDEVWLEGVWDAHDNDGSGLLEGAEWVKLVAAVRARPGRLSGLTVLHSRWEFISGFGTGVQGA